MKYNINNQKLDHNRGQINEEIVNQILSGSLSYSKEEVFQLFSGKGGLHGLKRQDFKSYHDYSSAKKEKEQGQFFTPGEIAQRIADLISPEENEKLGDIAAGAGMFINFFPHIENRFFGCEIDPDVYLVSRYLFPESKIENVDLREYNPPCRLDYILGNPPFNLRWEYQYEIRSSQSIYFNRAAAMLRPGGIVIAIVPESYCSDELFDGGEIDELNKRFRFLFQIKLDAAAFDSEGVSTFATKVIGLQRHTDFLTTQPFQNVFTDWYNAKTIIEESILPIRKNRHKIDAAIYSLDSVFGFKVAKYLYEFRTQATLKPYYEKALRLLDKLKFQRRPMAMSIDEWEARKLTQAKVLAVFKRKLSKQNDVPKDRLAIVKTNYGFRIKGYSSESTSSIVNFEVASWKMHDLVQSDSNEFPIPIEKGYWKLIEKKRKRYKLYETPLLMLKPANAAIGYLKKFSWNGSGGTCYLNKKQIKDVSVFLSRDYGILNWQQGSGKTPASQAWAEYQPFNNIFVVSAALAINMTWEPFLKLNGKRYVFVKSRQDIRGILPGDYVLLTHEYLIKLQHPMKRYIKSIGYKATLVMDESDELTNSLSLRTKAALNCFRKLRRKLLATGTTTRNNVTELYAQLTLLYNNSVNMLCRCQLIYKQDVKTKEILCDQNRKHYLKPFPAKRGSQLFKACFNPAKVTVFGVRQHNQNLFNAPQLRHIVERTVITRKFREIAGDKFSVNNICVEQNAAEKEVYRIIINEFHLMVRRYFAVSESTRKESLLRIIRQIQLLIQATSSPQFFKEYASSELPGKAKFLLKEIDILFNDQICIGCTTLKTAKWYYQVIRKRYPHRPIFLVVGDVTFKKRQEIKDLFMAASNGILVCTQQSLKSSVNIPTCRNVYIESLQWNIPKIEQFYFRFIRYDSIGRTNVNYITYKHTIENNLLALLMDKEKLNDFIKTLHYRDDSDIYREYDIDPDILMQLITKEVDDKGRVHLNWGAGSRAA